MIVVLGVGLVAFLVLARVHRRRRRNTSADALSLAMIGVPAVKQKRWRHKPYKGRWWV